jgi:hypothetical protein
MNLMEKKNLPDFIDENQYPDFWEQMKGFQAFAKSVGQGIAEGDGVLVSEEKIKEREKICIECSKFNKESKRCYLCGCYMEVKWKFKKSECPIKMW